MKYNLRDFIASGNTPVMLSKRRSRVLPLLAAFLFMIGITILPRMLSGRKFSLFEAASALSALSYSVRQMRSAELIDRLIKGRPTLLLDAREKEEQSISILPEAVLISPRQDFRTLPRYREFLQRYAGSPEAAVVVYCTAGYRSAKLLASMPDLKTLPVYNLYGGMIGYVNHGGWLVEPGTGRAVNRLHAYSSFWRLFVDSEVETTL